MRPIDAYHGRDEPSLEADNTAAFSCRYAVAQAKRWSAHAFRRAIDVNPVENPYLEAAGCTRAAGAPSLARGGAGHGGSGRPARAGVAGVGGPGGRWAGSPDYQHFSATGG